MIEQMEIIISFTPNEVQTPNISFTTDAIIGVPIPSEVPVEPSKPIMNKTSINFPINPEV